MGLFLTIKKYATTHVGCFFKVTRKWLQNLSTHGRISVDSELTNLVADEVLLHEIQQSTFTFPPDSNLLKTRLHVLKKDVVLNV